MRTETRSLKNFVLSASKQLSAKVESVLNPIYTPGDTTPLIRRIKERIAAVVRKQPYAAQRDAVCALMQGYAHGARCLGLVAEMGCGKTLHSVLSAVSMELVTGHPIRTLVLCPPHLVSTWKEEIEESLGKAALVINASGPNALSLLIRLRSDARIPDKPEFWLISFNRAKTNYSWKSSFFKQTKLSSLVQGTGSAGRHLYKTELCEHCSEKLPDDMDWSGAIRNRCPSCGNPLWGPSDKGSHVYAPVLYIKKYLNRHFHLAVFDEVQKLKGGSTIQGAFMGQIASAFPRSLVLTGTLSGGRASDVYYLLQRGFALNYSKEERRRLLPAYTDLMDFVKSYGSIEEIYNTASTDHLTGRSTREKRRIKETPGISPLLLKEFFLEHCVFLRLSDIADALPPYREEVEYCDLQPELAEAYQAFERTLKKAAQAALTKHDHRVLGQMLSSLLAWPDMPQRAVDVFDRDNCVVASAPALDIPLTAKDERLIECVRNAKAAGRKSLVFAEYTGKFGAGEHVHRILSDAGFNFLHLKPSVPTGKRLGWIRGHMASGAYDGLICQPKLVETGLNLREFPEILFWETGYSTYVLRQASRRSWRPGQTQDVVVRFFVNRNTMQEKAMSLIASKLEASLILEGELSDKGLVALSEMGDSMAVELARALVGQLETQGLEAQFRAYRSLEINRLPSSRTVALPPSRHQPRLGPIVGSLCGMDGGTVTGTLFRKPIRIDGENNCYHLVDVRGVTLAVWKGDQLVVYMPKKSQEAYTVIPDRALPGMNAWRIHQIAA